MKKKEIAVLIDGLMKLHSDLGDMIAALSGTEAPPRMQDAPVMEAPAEEPVPASAPEKVYTLEEVRSILAEKSRTGFRSEVKALITAHGAEQLSDITDPAELAALVREAEVIGSA